MSASRRLLLSVAMAAAMLLGLTVPSGAFAAAPWWQISSELGSTYLPPGGSGEIIVSVSDLGDEPVSGAKTQVTITDELPAGLTATYVGAAAESYYPLRPAMECTAPASTFSCTYTGSLNPYERLWIAVKVKVGESLSAGTTLHQKVAVQGGGAPSASATLALPVSGETPSFGVQGYQLSPFKEDGAPDTQAGSHPYQLTTTLVLNQTNKTGVRTPVALPKDLRFNLPPGLVGDPNATAQCTMVDFAAGVHESNLCPPASVVGVATVSAYEPITGEVVKTVPVFNLVPSEGEPARFGLEVIGKIQIVIDTAVSAEHDYAVTASVSDTTQTAWLLSSQVTLWGVPADPSHDDSRGWECVAGGAFAKQIGKACPAEPKLPTRPFLTLPTSCPANPAEEPLGSSAEAESWAAPGFLSRQYTWLSGGQEGEPLGMECLKQLPFAPAIEVTPEAQGAPQVHAASTPTGLSVSVHVPQGPTLEANPQGLAEADVRDTTVTLPEGVELNPAAANGRQACSEAEIGFTAYNAKEGIDEFTSAPASCPEASKVGIVHIRTPLLPHELEGAVYLATPAPSGEAGQNPFNSLVALYIVAEDKQAGVLVKLAGKGEIEESTGRVSTTFANTPQLPFEELKLELFGGQRASVSTPPFCGDHYPTHAEFTPWSGAGTVEAFSSAQAFQISSGVGGGPCPSDPLAFSPSFQAQSTNEHAGAFTPFTMEIVRPDGEQALTGLEVRLPPGVAALLSALTPCPEPPVGQEWACGAESLIGHATAVSGLGEDPVVLGGEVFLTGGYDGAPFGLLVATEAKAGPFDLGMVDVRSRIDVNPATAAVSIVTDPGPRGEALPTEIRGIPVQLKRILVSVDREHFEFNPTSCEPMRIEGTLSGSEGASAAVSSPFQVGECQSLPFAPKLTATASGHASKADGASLDVKIESGGVGPGGVAQAGIAKVDLQLPQALPSRLETLQKACLEKVFDANPAACDEGSLIGRATIHTPVLKSALTGPAYLVSHGGAAFPDVEFVLQGEGITLVLDGKTDIKDGITYSRFESAPDAPFTLFETELPAGPHSALTANVPEAEDFSLCKASLAMPTQITAQNGALIEQDTPIALTGCSGVLSSKVAKPTSAQRLAKALKACRARYKHSHAKRLACEAKARRKYGAKAARKTASSARKAAGHHV